VIVVTEFALVRAPSDIKGIVERNNLRLDMPGFLEAVERDVRLNVHPPFRKEEADQLGHLMRALLEDVFEHLASALTGLEPPVTVPATFQRLQAECEDVRDDIEPYAMLAELHFGVEITRRDRPTDELSKEIYEICDKAKRLKKRIVKFLRDLREYLSGAEIWR